MSPRLAPVLAALLAPGLVGACQEDTVPPVAVVHPTLIAVSPTAFIGDIPCLDATGAMRSYVATLFDVEYQPDGKPVSADPTGSDVSGAAGASDVDAGVNTQCPPSSGTGTEPFSSVGLTLVSSGPVDCLSPIAFSRVLEPHRYRAEIQGYALPPNQLAPLAPGLSILVDSASGKRVDPLWTFSCGDTCPEKALETGIRQLGDCKLLTGADQPAPGPANISVDTSTIVSPGAGAGAPACGSASGEVDHFEVDDQGTLTSSPCGGEVTLDDVPARGTLSISVFAYEAGNPDARWGTTCTAAPHAGLTVKATCAALVDEGSLDVDPGEALAALGSDCAALTTLPGELRLAPLDADGMELAPRFVEPATCGQAVRFAGLLSGPGRVRATLLRGATELGSALCEADVIPGTTVASDCSAEP